MTDWLTWKNLYSALSFLLLLYGLMLWCFGALVMNTIPAWRTVLSLPSGVVAMGLLGLAGWLYLSLALGFNNATDLEALKERIKELEVKQLIIKVKAK